jgi:hypothetical protein
VISSSQRPLPTTTKNTKNEHSYPQKDPNPPFQLSSRPTPYLAGLSGLAVTYINNININVILNFYKGIFNLIAEKQFRKNTFKVNNSYVINLRVREEDKEIVYPLMTTKSLPS